MRLKWVFLNLQLLIIKDTEQLLHQPVARERLVADDAGEVLLAFQQFLPWSIQQRVAQAVDSC